MNFLTRWTRRLALALTALALPASVSAKAPATKAAHPAMWEIRDADTTIYLFGTIHLLPEGTKWKSPKLQKAIEGSEELVVETIIDEKNPAEFMAAMASLGMSPNLPPILDRVSPDKRAALKASIAKGQIPIQAYDRLETWAAAFLLLGQQFADIGLNSAQGVEIVLRNEFIGDGKRIGQLETNAEQLGYFDRLSEDTQRQFLEGLLEGDGGSGNFKEQFAQMLKSWSKGDVVQIGKTFNEELSGSPELQEALLLQRNANWAKWVEQRMAQPGTLLLAVGAGHLAGPGSLIEILEHDRYKVTRIQ